MLQTDELKDSASKVFTDLQLNILNTSIPEGQAALTFLNYVIR